MSGIRNCTLSHQMIALVGNTSTLAALRILDGINEKVPLEAHPPNAYPT
jgi:hypothetical protein